jgi:2-hydroxy-3-keto-5-methylthiopentenyl-1-phosphate phosphatase
MLVFCDFDGTFSETDITNLIWDRHIWPDWRERLLPDYRAGKTTTLDLMAAGYRQLSQSADELLGSIRADIRIRSGFDRLVAECGARKWPLHIVSNGLDWYIENLLPPGIPVHCYRARLNGCWQVTLPDGVALEHGNDFKVHVCDKLRADHPRLETVFIGDGRNDFPAASRCDHVFAVKGSTLERLCAENGKAHVPFESFDLVVDTLIKA